MRVPYKELDWSWPFQMTATPIGNPPPFRNVPDDEAFSQSSQPRRRGSPTGLVISIYAVSDVSPRRVDCSFVSLLNSE